MDFKHLQRQKTYFMVIISTVNTEHTYDLIIHIFPFQNWTFIIVVYGNYYLSISVNIYLSTRV